MRACLLTLVLGGCLLIPADEHESRRLGETPATVATAGSAPEISDISFRFRYTSTGLIDGLWLVFKAVDADGDLAGGQVNTPDGFVRFSEATALTEDRWQVPLEWDFSEPCADNQREQPFEVVDEAGNIARPVLNVNYSFQTHSEEGQTSADQLEPVVTLAAEDLPAIVCGFKGVTNGFVDFFDEVEIFSGGEPLDVAVNYEAGAEDLAVFIFYNNEFQTSVDTSPSVGERVLFEPEAGPSYASISHESSAFPEANWVMFVQPQLPPEAP